MNVWKYQATNHDYEQNETHALFRYEQNQNRRLRRFALKACKVEYVSSFYSRPTSLIFCQLHTNHSQSNFSMECLTIFCIFCILTKDKSCLFYSIIRVSSSSVTWNNERYVFFRREMWYTYRRQIIFGTGKPDALHVMLIFWFSRTATDDGVDSMSKIFGGTETMEKEREKTKTWRVII